MASLLNKAADTVQQGADKAAEQAKASGLGDGVASQISGAGKTSADTIRNAAGGAEKTGQVSTSVKLSHVSASGISIRDSAMNREVRRYSSCGKLHYNGE
jgi:hypothetical protein